MVSAQGRSEALLARILEKGPGDGGETASITLEAEVPLLGDPGEVERGKPHLVGLKRALCPKKLRIIFPIKQRKRELVKSGNDGGVGNRFMAIDGGIKSGNGDGDWGKLIWVMGSLGAVGLAVAAAVGPVTEEELEDGMAGMPP